jgi:hypothetical protein
MKDIIVNIPRPEDLVSIENPWVKCRDGMTFKRVGIKVKDSDDAEYISLTLQRWLTEGKITLVFNLTQEEKFLLDL